MPNGIKYLLVLLASTTLIACSNGSSAASTNVNPNDKIETLIPSRFGNKELVISRISTVPTNNIPSTQYLRVDNYTGEDLQQESVNQFAKAPSTINAVACQRLLRNSSCMIELAPGAQDGATGFQLKYTTLDRKTTYLASQLVNFSSSVAPQNGFIVANDNINNVISTNNYNLTIPFIADDDYTSVEVKSRIWPIRQSVRCNTNPIIKGTSCTATIYMRIGNKDSVYANTITLIGNKENGAKNELQLTSGATYGDIANLPISGDFIINAKSNTDNYEEIILVNNGTKQADSVNTKIESGTSWVNNQIQNNTTYLTSDGIKCFSTGDEPLSVNAAIPNGDLCKIKITLTESMASGLSQFNLNYANPNNVQFWTNLVYNGSNSSSNTVNDYAYTLSGKLDFINTLVNNESNSGMVAGLKVTNTGQKDIMISGLENLPKADFSVAYESSPISCKEKSLLKVGEYCYYQIAYKPTKTQASQNVLLQVIATRADDKTRIITPERKIYLQYSAVETMGNLVIFNEENFGLYIGLNDVVGAKHTVSITNLGATDYTINSVNLESSIIWPDGDTGSLSITAPENLSNNLNYLKNPLFNMSFTDGVFLGNPITIQGGQTGELIYSYNNATVENTSRTVQRFNGTTGQVENEKLVVANYSAKADAIVALPEDPTCESNDCIGLSLIDSEGDLIKTLPSGAQFILLKSQMLQIGFRYKNGNINKSGFIIDDAMLPYGVTLNEKKTTCPTTTAIQNSGAREFNADAICSVFYNYMDPAKFKGELFYTTATIPGVQTMTIPSYSYKSSTNNVSGQLQQQFDFTPLRFGLVSVKVESVTAAAGNSSQYNAKLKFTRNALEDSGMQLDQINNAEINNAKLTVILPGAISTSGQDCNLESNGTCDLEVYLSSVSLGSVQFNVIYKSSLDGDYNQYYQNVVVPIPKVNLFSSTYADDPGKSDTKYENK